ncbi:MAG: DUF448 domain-containing protein [Desulfohalobiaceae bacterium]|nr:DUF448 domain-containing protein [Desulfohalobiaceae bacterium]
MKARTRSKAIPGQDSSQRTEKHVPFRMCVICRRRFPKSGLTRYVKRGSGSRKGIVYKDPGQDMAGRGFYICSSPACREKKEKITGLHAQCRG